MACKDTLLLNVKEASHILKEWKEWDVGSISEEQKVVGKIFSSFCNNNKTLAL